MSVGNEIVFVFLLGISFMLVYLAGIHLYSRLKYEFSKDYLILTWFAFKCIPIQSKKIKINDILEVGKANVWDFGVKNPCYNFGNFFSKNGVYITSKKSIHLWIVYCLYVTPDDADNFILQINNRRAKAR